MVKVCSAPSETREEGLLGDQGSVFKTGVSKGNSKYHKLPYYWDISCSWFITCLLTIFPEFWRSGCQQVCLLLMFLWGKCELSIPMLLFFWQHVLFLWRKAEQGRMWESTLSEGRSRQKSWRWRGTTGLLTHAPRPYWASMDFPDPAAAIFATKKWATNSVPPRVFGSKLTEVWVYVL